MRLVFIAAPDFPPLSMLSGIDFVASENPETLQDAEVVVLAPRYGDVLRRLLPTANKLRWVHALGAGVDTLPLDLLRHVVVTNSRGLYADALAEFVLAAMLWFAKDLPRLARNQAARKWEPYTVTRLEGARVGIVGYGGIGRAVGRRVEALGMHVAPVSRHEGDLDAVIASSDYVVVCTPLTPDTRGLIDAARISRMKRSAVLINVGRGPVVEESALVEALKNNRIRGAALDVFENEPLPPDHPLWRLDNVLISPHTADKTADSHERAMRFFLENLRRFEQGETLRNVVDPEAGY